MCYLRLKINAYKEMKKYLFAIHLLVFSLLIQFTCVSAQTDISKYYQFIHEAESHALKSQYEEALFFYDQAAAFDFMFGVDQYNALICSLKSGNDARRDEYLKKLGSTGFEIGPALKKYKIVIDDRLSKNSSIDETLAHQIQQLHVLDQEARNENMHQSFYALDDKIKVQLDSIHAIHGFLSEYKLGFASLVEKYHKLIIHQMKRDPAKYKLFLTEAVLTGQLRNTKFAWMASNFEPDSAYCFTCVHFGLGQLLEIGGQLYACNEGLKSFINSNRSRYFLKPVEAAIEDDVYRYRSGSDLKIGQKPARYPDLHPENYEAFRKEIEGKGFVRYGE